MLKTYLANALVAAALGAGTNELAIVAILRHILPRKKGEIARRIRDIVATDLLSPEKMREKLDEPQVGDLLEKNVDRAMEEILSRDLPSPDELLKNHRAETDALAGRLAASLLDEFSRRVADPKFTDDVLRPFLEERWQALGKRTPRSLMTNQADKLPEYVKDWIGSLWTADATRESVRRALDNWLAERISGAANPAEILSPGLAAAAEELAASQAPVIVRQLTDVLREPDMRNTIAAGVMNAIHGQLRGQGILGDVKGMLVGAMGVRKDVMGVCDRLPDALEENFRHPANRDRFVASLRAAVRKGLNHELDEDFRTPDRRGRIVDMVLGGLWREETFARLGAGVGEFVEERLGTTLDEIASGMGVDGAREGVLDEVAARCRRILLSPATRELLAGQMGEFVAAWRARPLGRLDRFVTPDARARLAAVAAREGRELLRQRLAEFAEEAGVWDIVTSSIENYDDKQLANLIQQLARSELRWVTILGGVIGAMVGIVQTAFQSYGVL